MEEKHLKYLFIPAVLIIITILIVTSREGYDDKGNKDINNVSKSNEVGSALGLSAEQTGSSPESGATSKLKQAYDWLDAKGANYGDSQPSDWPYTHSTYWQRIIYSAMWEPDGTATESDVLSGKTFYSGLNNRVQKTGTGEYQIPSFFEQQSLIEYDDYESGDSSEDSALEESSWTSPATNVWLDTRTGL